MRQGLILLAPDPAVRHEDLGCFGICEAGEDPSVRRHHLLIMRLFREAAEENAGRPLYIPELCSAIGVPERTVATRYGFWQFGRAGECSAPSPIPLRTLLPIESQQSEAGCCRGDVRRRRVAGGAGGAIGYLFCDTRFTQTAFSPGQR